MSHPLLQPLRHTLTAALSAVALGAAAAPQYHVQPLYNGPPEDSGVSRAHGIAADGRVLIGQNAVGSWATASFVCEVGHHCDWIPGFPGGWAQTVDGLGMNRLGAVTGQSSSAGRLHAFHFDGQTLIDVGRVRGDCDGCGAFLDSTGYALNDAGIVVGAAQFAAGEPMRAFRWAAGRMEDLGTLGGRSSEARAINRRGHIVGTAALPGDTTTHAFIHRGSTMRDLGTLGGDSSWAMGINRFGVVVGCSQQAAGQPQAAFAYYAGVMMALADRKQAHGCAQAISDNGVIVGYSLRAGGAQAVAVRYVKGRAVDLNTLVEPLSGQGWALREATAVNDAGQIVGNGTYKGRTRAFVLTPLR